MKRKGLCTHDQDLHQTCYRYDSRVSRCEVIKVPAMLSCLVPHVPSACSACITCDAPFEQSMLADSGLGWVKYKFLIDLVKVFKYFIIQESKLKVELPNLILSIEIKGIY